jgi:hypothetical protein
MQTLTQNQTNVNGLTAVEADGLSLLLLPGEDAAAVVASVETFLAETDARPWVGFGDEPELSRLWGGAPDTDRHSFYHGHGCDCPRCAKASTCEVHVHGVGSGAIAYRVDTPKGKRYMPVVNIHSEVVTCNCPNGQHLYRATCYHAQAAWLNYTTRDRVPAF